MTYGWHQISAEISNSVFARKANKSKQGIIKAKKQLEETGVLIVLGKGGGSKTNEYMLDLWYDNPDKSVKASIIRQEEQLLEIENTSPQEEQEDIPELLEAPAIDEPTTFEEPEVEMEIPSMKIESSTEQEENPPYEENVLESQPETGENPNCGIPEPPQVVESENHAPEEPNSEQEISDTESAENPSNIEDSESLTSKLSLPPYKEDLSNNKSSEKEKQTEEPKPEKKKAAAAVRYQFFSLFPDTKADDDWKFFGWVAKTYGLDTCLAKLDYMKEHRKQHSITNPKGFFRTALVKDFQPPAFVLAKLKADEAARREKERCRKESEEWRSMTAGFSYETASASLRKLLDTLN